MSRIPLTTDYKTRTGAPDKDARLKNAYIETRGEQSVVRRRPSGQGGIAVGTGTAQGGIGFNIAGTDYFIGFWADTMQTYTGGGTSWNSGTSYLTGDRVAVDFVDYWAINDNTNSQPPSVNWSRSYVPDVPVVITYATWNPAEITGTEITLSNGNLTANFSYTTESSIKSTISKSSGKWYWEYAVNYNAVNYLSLGIGNSLMNHFALVGGVDAFGWAYTSSSDLGQSYKVNNGIYTPYASLYVTGDVIGVALDMDTGTIKFYLNGVDKGIAFSGLTGNIFAASGHYGGVININGIVTANFGASAFAYSVPSGYNSGLYT